MKTSVTTRKSKNYLYKGKMYYFMKNKYPEFCINIINV